MGEASKVVDLKICGEMSHDVAEYGYKKSYNHFLKHFSVKPTISPIILTLMTFYPFLLRPLQRDRGRYGRVHRAGFHPQPDLRRQVARRARPRILAQEEKGETKRTFNHIRMS